MLALVTNELSASNNQLASEIRKLNTGFKLTYPDSGNMVHFLFLTIFSTYPENHDTKSFCFPNQGTKTILSGR